MRAATACAAGFGVGRRLAREPLNLGLGGVRRRRQQGGAVKDARRASLKRAGADAIDDLDAAELQMQLNEMEREEFAWRPSCEPFLARTFLPFLVGSMGVAF